MTGIISGDRRSAPSCPFPGRVPWGGRRDRRIVSILLVVVLAGAIPLLRPRAARARVRLENICTIYGQKEVKLTGLGLVVGLNGTGDGGRNLPAMRALAAALKLMNAPVLDAEELRDADNVAMVLIEATIPKTGLRRGQSIDCYVSSFMGAESLRGGRLLVSPVETADVRDGRVAGLASGPINIENPDVPTSGIIPGGLVLEDNFLSRFIDEEFKVTLLLDESHASFHTASEVARVINQFYSYQRTDGDQLPRNRRAGFHPARAVSPSVIEVQIPTFYRDVPVEFIAEVMEIGIDNPHTQAEVIVNSKTGTVVVTGEVEISPVVITHENLTVEVGTADPANRTPPPAGPFVPVAEQGGQAPQRLQGLVGALNQLQVPTDDVISIIRELHRSGKLHAAYEEY